MDGTSASDGNADAEIVEGPPVSHSQQKGKESPGMSSYGKWCVMAAMVVAGIVYFMRPARQSNGLRQRLLVDQSHSSDAEAAELLGSVDAGADALRNTGAKQKMKGCTGNITVDADVQEPAALDQGIGTRTVKAKMINDKPKADPREYQYFQLANGLTVINVRDAKSAKSAFAMAVKAGSYDNPVDLPGLAHFCEHMLFLGSKKYPVPDGFDDFLSSNGGSSNAYTDTEVTVYHGDYQASASSEALLRVADIFSEPTFNRKYVDKEVHAINSEHEKNVRSPGWRIHDTVLSLANPRSPVSRFATGDLETLSEDPKKKGIDLVERLKVYFADFYCPEQMILVTYGPDDLPSQLNASVEDFGKMQKGNANCTKAHANFTKPNPWPKDRLAKFVTIKGTTPASMIRLVFPLPDLEHEYTQGVQRYFSHVIGYRGIGSLGRTLEDHLGLTTSLGVSFSTSSAGSLMNIYAEVTALGRNNTPVVLDQILAYLAAMKLRGVDLGVYKSLQSSSKLLWDWPSLHSAAETASTLARVATVVPPDQLLSAGRRIDKLDSKLLTSLMEYIDTANMNIIFVDGTSFDLSTAPVNLSNATFSKLPHYGVKYAVQELKEVMPAELNKWRNWLAGSVTEARLSAAVVATVDSAKVPHNKTPTPVFPKPVEGIPSNVSLTDMAASKVAGNAGPDLKLFGPEPLPFKASASSTNSSSLLVSKGEVQGLHPKLFYRKGWMTKSPFSTFVISFRALTANDTPEVTPTESVLITLYSRLFSEMITPNMADLSELGLDFGVSVGTSSLRFVFTGFTPLIPKLAKQVLGFFNKFNMNTSLTEPARFERVRTSLKQELSSYSKMPVYYAVSDLGTIMQKSSHSRAELLKALENISAVNVKTMAAAAASIVLSKPLELTSLVMGNVNEKEAQTVVHEIAGNVALPPFVKVSTPSSSDAVQLVPSIVQIVNPVELRMSNPRDQDTNNVVIVRVMHGVADVPSRVILGILGDMLQHVAFYELRTKRQLGYVVSGGTSMIGNVMYVSCVVQGTAKTSDEMESLIEYVYSVALPAKLDNMTDKELESHRAAFKQKLIDPPTSIKEEMNHWLASVMKNGHCFGLRDSMLNFAESEVVNVKALRDTWMNLMVPETGIRNKTVMKIFAGKVPTRPTSKEAAAEAEKAGVSKASAALLAREYKATQLLDSADSAAREKLKKLGGYYPKTLHCGDPDDPLTPKVSAHAVAEVAGEQTTASPKAAAGSSVAASSAATTTVSAVSAKASSAAVASAATTEATSVKASSTAAVATSKLAAAKAAKVVAASAQTAARTTTAAVLASAAATTAVPSRATAKLPEKATAKVATAAKTPAAIAKEELPNKATAKVAAAAKTATATAKEELPNKATENVAAAATAASATAKAALPKKATAEVAAAEMTRAATTTAALPKKAIVTVAPATTTTGSTATAALVKRAATTAAAPATTASARLAAKKTAASQAGAAATTAAPEVATATVASAAATAPVPAFAHIAKSPTARTTQAAVASAGAATPAAGVGAPVLPASGATTPQAPAVVVPARPSVLMQADMAMEAVDAAGIAAPAAKRVAASSHVDSMHAVLQRNLAALRLGKAHQSAHFMQRPPPLEPFSSRREHWKGVQELLASD